MGFLVSVDGCQVGLSDLFCGKDIKNALLLRDVATYLSSKINKFDYATKQGVVGNKVFDYSDEFGDEFVRLFKSDVGLSEEEINEKDRTVSEYIYKNRSLLGKIFLDQREKKKIEDSYQGYSNDCSGNMIIHLKKIMNAHLFDNEVDRCLYNVYCDGMIFPFVTEIQQKTKRDILGFGDDNLIDIFAEEENALTSLLDNWYLNLDELRNYFSVFADPTIVTEIICKNIHGYEFDEVSEAQLFDDASSVTVLRIRERLREFLTNEEAIINLEIRSDGGSDRESGSSGSDSSDSAASTTPLNTQEKPSTTPLLEKEGNRSWCSKFCNFISGGSTPVFKRGG